MGRRSALPAEIRSALVVGYGLTARAITEFLVRRGVSVVVADDRPTPTTADDVAAAGARFAGSPDQAGWAALVGNVDVVLPSPGVPMHHPVYRHADLLGVAVGSELDLAARHDDRPIGAITGTNGKTTVTTLATLMCRAAGIAALDAGNTDTPLVAAIEDPTWEVFVVEASSFRLERAEEFHPRIAAYLNLAPDHLDWHPSVEEYAAAKARIWMNQTPDEVALIPAGDELLAELAELAPSRVETVGLDEGDHRVVDGWLVAADGARLVEVAELPRRGPHDLTNALFGAAVARGLGATVEAVASTLRDFEGLAHRIRLVAESGGVRWYDDSKATTPHATLTALAGFPSVVLIAGGKNKGVDLSVLASEAARLRGVVAIGDAAPVIVDAFTGVVPVEVAPSMDAAVVTAGRLARPGDAVLLSPSCASFDWYSGYGERGDDFIRAVRDHLDQQGTR
jgi:UDP-N-acetylmuramoylalanine--D-glutamate ligase